MKTTPRFSIGERVQASIDNCPLDGVGKVREILGAVDGVWRYKVEAEGVEKPLQVKETELAPVDTPTTRAKARQETIEHHARQARQWADAADAAECEPDPEDGGPRRGQRYAQISQAHAFASISSVLAESSIGIEQ